MTTSLNSRAPRPTTLVTALEDLHASYVAQINHAVDTGEDDMAAQLAAAYDDDAIQLVAEWEQKAHLLPIARRRLHDTPLRRLVRHLLSRRVAA